MLKEHIFILNCISDAKITHSAYCIFVYIYFTYVCICFNKTQNPVKQGDLVYVDDFDLIKYFARYTYLRPFVSDSSLNLPNNLNSCLPCPHFKDENNKGPDSLKNILQIIQQY